MSYEVIRDPHCPPDRVYFIDTRYVIIHKPETPRKRGLLTRWWRYANAWFHVRTFLRAIGWPGA